jgi:hypothetical protein
MTILGRILMEKRISVVSGITFIALLLMFSMRLAHQWSGLNQKARLDEVYLACLFLGLMVQLWRDKAKTRWIQMTTTTVIFLTLTHLLMGA